LEELMKPDLLTQKSRDLLRNGDHAMNQAARDFNNPDSLQARQRAARRLLGGGPIDITSKAYKAAQRRMLGLPPE
jgi:hypothetical protein